MDLIIKQKRAYWGDHSFPCTIGKNGISSDKREGDLATPIGSFPFRHVYWRPDRQDKPSTVLPCTTIQDSFGWCDDPESPDYNRLVSLPHNARHEKMWREDHLYDIVLTVGHNDSPAIPGKGSAVFVHLMRNHDSPTHGCVAFTPNDLLYVLKTCDVNSQLIVEP